MKRKSVAYAVSLLFVFYITAADAMALGLGFNLSGGGGTSEWTLEDQWVYAEYDEDVETGQAGIGFVLDTTVAKDGIFNYRLNIGIEEGEYEFEDGGGSFETAGWFMAHDFGFAIVRKKNLRLWAGPEIRWSYSHGEDEIDSSIELDVITWGVGPVVGLNFNFRKGLTLALKAGALGTSSVGRIEDKGMGLEWDIEGSGAYSFFNVGLIFRLGDEYP